MNRFLPALMALAAVASTVSAQPGADALAATPPGWKPKKFADVADVSLTVDRPSAKRGETVVVRLTVTPKNEGWTYPTHPKDPAQESKNTIDLPPPGDLIFISGVTDPPAKIKPEAPGEQYYPNKAVWEFKAVVSPKAAAGMKTVSLGEKTRIQACREKCFTIPGFGSKLPTAQLEVVEGASDRVNQADLAAALQILQPGSPAKAGPEVRAAGVSDTVPKPGMLTTVEAPVASDHGRKAAKPIADYQAGLATVEEQLLSEERIDLPEVEKKNDLWGFLATAALWGLISLVTPCVFPMIPITVSIFLKQAHGSLGERLKLAGVYCLTIVGVLGVSAFALLKFMAWLSAHPVTNLLLAGLFLVLALSLFGMYELTLPNFMVRRLQAKQAKGGVVGTVFGALAFTVISFTCVAPFLGGFAGISAADTGGSLISIPTTREIFGGLAFATAFAAPFFVLALVPGLMRALPRSGGWLDSVKVVMGFLELAAALKFLRTAELRILPTPAYFTYDLVLGGWVAICAACGLYLLNVYRLPHDEERPNIGVMRLLFATLFLGLGLYLFPATFKTADGKGQRPSGAVYAWVEAFLLPDVEKESTDLKDAIDRARKSKKPVFLDFTGVTCTNCKYNEQSVFTRPEMQELFRQFEKVQLYTDEVPANAYSTDPGKDQREQEARANRDFQINAFKDSALPLYAVLMPQVDGKVKVVGVYDEGKINAPEKFAKYLREMLEKAKK